MTNGKNIFISYFRSNGFTFAEALSHSLVELGHEVWYDKRKMNPLQDYGTQLERAIRHSDCVVIIFDQNTSTISDPLVQREVFYAVHKHIPIIILKVTNHALPFLFAPWLTVDFHTAPLQTSVQALHSLLQENQLPTVPEFYDPLSHYLDDLYEEVIGHLEDSILIDEDQSPFWERTFSNDQDLPNEPHETFNSLLEAYNAFGQRLVLLGKPGAGKTTTLYAFVRDAVVTRWHDPMAPVPILLNISSWNFSQFESVLDWVQRVRPTLNEHVETLLEHGNLLLVLDSLDALLPSVGLTISTRSNQIRSFNPREVFLKQLPDRIPVIVSCRLADYGRLVGKSRLHSTISLTPLSKNIQRAIVETSPIIQHLIQAYPSLEAVIDVPLFLRILRFVYADLDEVPTLFDNVDALQGDILNRYIDRVYELGTQYDSAPFSLHRLRDVLGEIAMRNAGGVGDMNAIEYDAIAKPLLVYEHPDEFMSLAMQIHLLTPNHDGSYRFVHRKIRDILAYEFAIPRVKDADWFEPLTPVTANLGNPAVALAATHDARVIPALLEVWMSHKVLRVRTASATALADIGGQRVVNALAQTLTNLDEPTEVRDAAIRGLGLIGNVQATTTLLGILTNPSERSDLRDSAVRALAGIANKQAIMGLIQVFNDLSYDTRIRRTVAEALGEVGGQRATTSLVQVLSNASVDRSIRSASVRALINIGGEQASGVLVQVLLNSSRDSFGRDSAARALGLIGGERATSVLTKVLLDANDTDAKRGSAAYALGMIGEDVATKVMLEVFTNRADDPLVRGASARALGMLGDYQVNDTLYHVLQDRNDDNHVRSSAAYALSLIGSQDAIHILTTFALDIQTDPLVRDACARALVKLGGQDANQGLIRILNESKDDSWILSYVARSLTHIGTPTALSAVEAWEKRRRR